MTLVACVQGRNNGLAHQTRQGNSTSSYNGNMFAWIAHLTRDLPRGHVIKLCIVLAANAREVRTHLVQRTCLKVQTPVNMREQGRCMSPATLLVMIACDDHDTDTQNS